MSQFERNAGVSPDVIAAAMQDDFAALLDETFAPKSVVGNVVTGVVVALEAEHAVVDVGMKAEGRVALREFAEAGKPATLNVGDTVQVYVDSLDDVTGHAVLSHEKAKREASLVELERQFNDKERVKGVIFGKVKGGFTVDVNGVLAFMPGSQVDARPLKDITHLMYTPQEMLIIKMDRKRSNVIVSRRAIQDEAQSASRDEVLKEMTEGRVLEGTVKNITDYGAFVDLGGVDGLLHITDISWQRINHPSEMLQVGQTVKVQIIRYNEENKRVSLGMKQLAQDPWSQAETGFTVGQRVKGKVASVTDYGAFVELAPGVEGLIHVSEMSWTRKNVHPGKILSESQQVEVLVLEIDRDKRRISLGLKQCQENPWDVYTRNAKVGDVVEGTVRNITDFGIFVGLTDDIDGLVHMSDISWDKSGDEALKEFKKGDAIKAKILAIDVEKERVSLGIKQLDERAGAGATATATKGGKKAGQVTAEVTAVEADHITVKLADGSTANIRKGDLSATREAQDTSRFTVGQTINAKWGTDAKKQPVLSIKALELAEEKEAVRSYANKNDGKAALGDLLGEALKGNK